MIQKGLTYSVIFSLIPPFKVPSSEKMILARLGLSRKIYISADSPNLGFPFLGGTCEKDHPLWLYVEASALFLLKVYPLSESYQQCVCHVQPGPNSGFAKSKYSLQDLLQGHLIINERNKWNTGVQRGIQHDWPQQVWPKDKKLYFLEKIHQLTTGMDS